MNGLNEQEAHASSSYEIVAIEDVQTFDHLWLSSAFGVILIGVVTVWAFSNTTKP